jgi:hypothetical protein
MVRRGFFTARYERRTTRYVSHRRWLRVEIGQLIASRSRRKKAGDGEGPAPCWVETAVGSRDPEVAVLKVALRIDTSRCLHSVSGDHP